MAQNAKRRVCTQVVLAAPFPRKPLKNVRGSAVCFGGISAAIASSNDPRCAESGRPSTRGPWRHAPDLSDACLLGQFFSDAVEALPAIDFPHDLGGRNAAFCPDDGQMIEDV